MFGIRYLKASPMTYVIQFKNGLPKRQGAGLSFFYYAPTSTLSAVPLASADLPFVFSETTADFQSIAVQGQITYRIADPQKVAALLDYTIDPYGAYRSEGPDTLGQRIINEAQILANAYVRRLPLKQVLPSAQALCADVQSGLKSSAALAMLGVDVISLSILAVKPTPETSRALEAEAREALLKEADQAIYERRNYAVEQERKIKESELNTEIAIRERQTNADIDIEEKRKSLIALQTDNERTEADSKAYALQAVLKPVAGIDWKTLMVLGKGGLDPKLMVALAFREIAENADKIGSLNITPDLLQSLLEKK